MTYDAHFRVAVFDDSLFLVLFLFFSPSFLLLLLQGLRCFFFVGDGL